MIQDNAITRNGTVNAPTRVTEPKKDFLSSNYSPSKRYFVPILLPSKTEKSSTFHELVPTMRSRLRDPLFFKSVSINLMRQCETNPDVRSLRELIVAQGKMQGSDGMTTCH